ncbi:uncharacterized protein LOC142348419 [Convolutriloba macropyga]|uniref:uncharacterized protein LOC142348419 n=1 Tax=Convolutriloba macropyga TaxID=536237 RepID=UPI003F525A71
MKMHYVASLAPFTFILLASFCGFCECYESLEFILPDTENKLGKRCHDFSGFFCLRKYYITARVSPRVFHWSDTMRMHKLASQVFFNYNWFSLDPKDEDHGCCYSQIKTYMSYGQPFGLSPDQYVARMTDLTSSTYRRLNTVRLRYDWLKCLNIIERIGFGDGNIVKLEGGFPNRSIALPPNPTGDLFVFRSDAIDKEMTFDWFKKNIMCPDQPWICMQYP